VEVKRGGEPGDGSLHAKAPLPPKGTARRRVKQSATRMSILGSVPERPHVSLNRLSYFVEYENVEGGGATQSRTVPWGGTSVQRGGPEESLMRTKTEKVRGGRFRGRKNGIRRKSKRT